MSNNIVQCNDCQKNWLLRRKAEPVTDFECTTYRQYVEAMLDRLKQERNCIALAGTQLDIEGSPLHVMVTKLSGQHLECLVNVKILGYSGRQIGYEGCMSIPGRPVSKTRHAIIFVHAQNRAGQDVYFKATGFHARVIQHEYDHLVGKLITDNDAPDRLERADTTANIEIAGFLMLLGLVGVMMFFDLPPWLLCVVIGLSVIPYIQSISFSSVAPIEFYHDKTALLQAAPESCRDSFACRPCMPSTNLTSGQECTGLTRGQRTSRLTTIVYDPAGTAVGDKRA